jgi:hypothetical protein
MTVASLAHAEPAGLSACFGGTPETAVADAGRIDGLSIDDRYLHWVGRRMDLASGAVSPGLGDASGVSDGREAFGVTGQNELIATDLATGKSRMVVDGRRRIQDFMGLSMLALDARYVYFGIGERLRGGKEAGFFRVARDGAQPPEKIAPTPRVPSPFVIADGFVYWAERAGLLRRALAPGAPQETIVAAADPVRPRPPLRIAAGRIYYVDRQSIWSRAVDGSGASTEEAALGSDPLRSVVVVPPCLYFATGRAIRRARLQDDPKASQLIADERSYAGDIVSDGRFLYWADVRAGRIMRAAPSATTSVPPPPAPVTVAAPAQATRPAPAEAVAVGEGWGCARVSVRDEVDHAWQCWQAPARAPAGGPAAAPPAIAARKIPWLIGNWLATAPGRVCAVVGAETRCWAAPAFIRGARPAAVPTRQYAGTAQAAASDTIACVSEPKAGDPTHAWRCTGDERTGPTEIDTSAWLDKGGSHIALGRWHACVTSRGETMCWGRGDGGQLGFPAEDRCGPAGHRVACAKEPAAPPFKPAGTLFAGDMFTCVSSQGPLACWGASRDGLFGTAEACPTGLREAWPTGSGTVPASAATCSAAPVDVPGFKHGRYDLSVGPRGICAIVQGHVRCAGAIKTPAINVTAPRVSPGDDASACGLNGDEVVCWGERYSPADDPTQPVTIALETATAAGMPVVDSPAPPGAAWADACDIHFGCERAAAPLPVCAPRTTGRPWSALLPDAKKLQGTTVEVSGRLYVGRAGARGTTVTSAGAFETGPSTCGPGQCCNHEIRPIVVADDAAGAGEGLGLEELACRGDDSRVCCNAPARGQAVIATGKLTSGWGRWKLAPAEVCAVPVIRRH